MDQCRTCYIHQRKRYDDPNGHCEFLRNTLFATKGAHPHEAEADECVLAPDFSSPVSRRRQGGGPSPLCVPSHPSIYPLVSFEQDQPVRFSPTIYSRWDEDEERKTEQRLSPLTPPASPPPPSFHPSCEVVRCMRSKTVSRTRWKRTRSSCV